MPRAQLAIVIASVALTSCAHEGAFVGKSTPIDQCVVGRRCLVEGILVATEKMGSIRATENENASECIAVALSAGVPDSWNLRHVKAIGMVSRRPNLPGMFRYKLKDR